MLSDFSNLLSVHIVSETPSAGRTAEQQATSAVQPVGPPSSCPGLRWWIVSLLFLAAVLNYVDKNTLALLAPDHSERPRL